MKLKYGLTAAAMLGVMTSLAAAEAELTDEGYHAVMNMLDSGEWSVRTKWPLASNRDNANRDGEVLFIPITVHVVRSDGGQGGVDIAAVDAAITVANSKFNDTDAGNFGYTFYRESVQFLDDDDYFWFHMDDGELGTLIQQSPVPGTVNAYFVPHFVSLDPISGVSTLPYSGAGGMAISNDGTGALTHEMGHYFGLFHPFGWDSFGDECATGDGCQYSGDLICETPADPGTDWWGNFRAPGARPAGYCYRCDTDYIHDWDPGANDGLGAMTDEDCIWGDVDCDDRGPDCHTPFGHCEDPIQCHLYEPLTQNIMSYYGIQESFVSEQLSLMRANLQFMLADHVRSDRDCNGNDLPDSFEIESVWYETQDCDGNGRPDDCDIADSSALDCDADGLIDHCEIALGLETDCDENGQIDRCDVVNFPDRDCNSNNILDLCEIQSGDESDCNGNSIPDTCDLFDDPSQDCDGNGQFDACDIGSGEARDCDGNGVIDVCELPSLPEKDCNGNGVFDDCEVVDGFESDCDADGVLDSCQLDGDSGLDCDGSGVLDSCEIADGTLEDCDNSGLPDSCEESLVRVYGPLAPFTAPYQAHFAASLDLHGVHAVFGIPGDNGAATSAGAASVYRRLDADTWELESTVRLDGGTSYDVLGSAVALGEDVLAAGVPGDDDNGSNSGLVAIYRKTGGVWGQETVLYGSDTGAGDGFGSALAMDDSTLVVGAPDAEASDTSGATGVVYMFQDAESIWSETARLTASDGSIGDQFGVAVAIDGSRALVGASNAYTSAPHAGAVYAYRFDGESWTSDGMLTDSAPNLFNAFGSAVDLDDNWAAVGIPGADVSGHNGAGAVDVFERTAGGWVHRARVSASDASASDAFGAQVSIEGDLLLVSAPSHDGRGVIIPNAGGVYVFVRQGATWIESGLVTASDPDVGAKFGAAMTASGALSVIGAPFANGTLNDTGAAYVAIQLDCDQNGEVDSCQVDGGSGEDCDGDGILDGCAVDMGIVEDCNFNLVPDACDLANSPGLDTDGNGIIDACEGPNGFPGGEDGFALADLVRVIEYWGTSDAQSDHDGDGIVGIIDLIYVLQGWHNG
jgi:hypothetical protein